MANHDQSPDRVTGVPVHSPFTRHTHIPLIEDGVGRGTPLHSAAK